MQQKKWLWLLLMIPFILILWAFSINDQPDLPIQEAPKVVSSLIEEKEVLPIIPSFLPEDNSEPRENPISHVVIHFTSNVLNNPEEPYHVESIRKLFMDAGVSAHYLIGRQGEIYQLVEENRVAYHAGKGNLINFLHYIDALNDFSIGIELMAIGTKEEMITMMPESIYDSIDPDNIGYTEKQYQTLNLLLDDILLRNPAISRDRDHIVGHEEYAPERKTDPGSLFDWENIGF